MDYVDFCLEVRALTSTRCRISARSPRGDHEGEVDLPMSLEALGEARSCLQGAALRGARASRQTESAAGARSARDLYPDETPTIDAQTFGRSIYEAMFQGPFGEVFSANREYTRQSGRGVRVKVVTPDARLALVPWELLCSHRGDYLSLSEATPLVRYVLVDKPQTSLRVEPPLRVLGVLSTGGERPLDLGRERACIDLELDALRRKGLVEIEWLEEPTSQALLDVLDRKEWHIVHFAGHGTFDPLTSQGLLSMTAEGGGRGHLRANDLRVLLRDRPSVRLVFLNSCDGAVGDTREFFSSTAALVAEAGIPAVLAMQFPISDTVAIRFARRVYRQIAAGAPLESAVTQARKDIYISGSLEWATPVLFMRPAEGAMLALPEPPGPISGSSFATKRSAWILFACTAALVALAAYALRLGRGSDEASSSSDEASSSSDEASSSAGMTQLATTQQAPGPLPSAPGSPSAPVSAPAPTAAPGSSSQKKSIRPSGTRPEPSAAPPEPASSASAPLPEQVTPERAEALKRINDEIQAKKKRQLEECSRLVDTPMIRDACMSDYSREIENLEEMRRALDNHTAR
ncbi:CHAT domain-containing protein [Sorangium sp. So ce117]|uniref:CHAT domain-containing protein n=1 Tax=Sorangium sp. So ce117 TaxID=3133277 RepID=UPI003F5DFB64